MKLYDEIKALLKKKQEYYELYEKYSALTINTFIYIDNSFNIKILLSIKYRYESINYIYIFEIIHFL